MNRTRISGIHTCSVSSVCHSHQIQSGSKTHNESKTNFPVFVVFVSATNRTQKQSIGTYYFDTIHTFFNSPFLLRYLSIRNSDPFAMAATIGNSFISITPPELRFQCMLSQPLFRRDQLIYLINHYLCYC